MSKPKPTLGREYFEAIYAADPDPWKFATSDYERRKYAVTLSALPRARYTSGLEIGCSIGVLTKILGARCDSVLGVDVAASALSQARQRCAMLPNVWFAQLAAPGQWPQGHFGARPTPPR
jgi:hypothetical protein